MATYFAVLLTLLAGLSWTSVVHAAITVNCMTCICARNDCEKREGAAPTDNACGPFYISPKYFNDSLTLGQTYESCTQSMACSQTVVRNYMALYADKCTGGNTTCADYARIHWSQNPLGCRPLKETWKEAGLLYTVKLVLQYCDAIPGGCEDTGANQNNVDNNSAMLPAIDNGLN